MRTRSLRTVRAEGENPQRHLPALSRRNFRVRDQPALHPAAARSTGLAGCRWRGEEGSAEGGRAGVDHGAVRARAVHAALLRAKVPVQPAVRAQHIGRQFAAGQDVAAGRAGALVLRRGALRVRREARDGRQPRVR